MRTIAGFIGLVATLAVAQQPLIQAAGPDEIPFSQLQVGIDSPIKTSGVQVITDQKAWKDYVTKIGITDLNKPKIDWTKYQVVIATLEGSSKDGIALEVLRLHKTKPGMADIEFQMSKDHTANRYVDQATSHNTLGKPEFPYAILKTPISNTKWSIRVLD